MGLFDLFKSNNDNSDAARQGITDSIEYLLEKAATEPGLRPKFYKTLLDSELIVLTHEHFGKEGVHTLAGNTTLKLVTTRDGKIPVFTSTDRIFDKGLIKTEVPFLGLNGRSLLETTKGATLVLNPFSDHTKELAAEEIDELLNGNIFRPEKPEEIKQHTKVRIGQPAAGRIPAGLDKSLIEFAKTRINIKAIYIAMIERVGSGNLPSLMIALRLSNSDQQVFGELGEVIRPYVSNDTHIEMMEINGNEGLSGYFDSVQSIYKK